MRRVLLALALLLAAGAGHAAEDRLTGPAKVRGPDTLAIAGARVRFAGVVPPEEASRCAGGVACADAAADALGALVAQAEVSCVKERRLGHGYFQGRCRTGDGSDLALVLIERGLLRPDPATAPANYVQAAEAAKAAQAGLWGS